MPDSIEHPMRALCDEWMSKIRIAQQVKHHRFGKEAQEAQQFFDGPHDFMWQQEYATAKGGFLDKDAFGGGFLPTFRMTVNKPFEAVALFGPALFFKYPYITVSHINRPELDPEALGIAPVDELGVQQYQSFLISQENEARILSTHARVMEHYLNWLQYETQKKVPARRAITEAIVKGLGLLTVDLYRPPGSKIRYPRCSYKSCDDLVKDPDACYHEDVQWIALRYIAPVNIVEKQFGYKPGELKGHYQSYAAQANPELRNAAKQGGIKGAHSYDLMEYWKVYSKNGFGHRLKSSNKIALKSKYNFDFLGDNTFLVVSPGIPFPLNMPSWSLAEGEEQVFMRAQWPIPFWVDSECGNGWPLVELSFFDRSKSVWPMGMFKSVIGELRFINWCMSFLADKTASSATDYLLMAKAAGAQIQDQLQRGSAPYTIIELSQILNRSVDDLVQWLQAPSFNIDIWRMVAEVMEIIDRRTGLTELIYGLTGTQIRSATEADIRNENVAIRPDEMASRTEDWLGQSAMKEIEAAIWSLDREDVLPVLGEAATSIFVDQIQAQSFDEVIRSYSFRVEAGTARKPNKNNRVRQLTEISKFLLPVLQQFAASGIVEPFNAFMEDMADALDMDASRYRVEIPQPPEGEEGGGEDDMERERQEQELRYQADRNAIDLISRVRRAQVDIAAAKAKAAAQSNGSK